MGGLLGCFLSHQKDLVISLSLIAFFAARHYNEAKQQTFWEKLETRCETS